MNCGRHKCQYVLFTQCNLCQLAEVSEECLVLSSVRTVTVKPDPLCMKGEIGLTTVDGLLGMSVYNIHQKFPLSVLSVVWKNVLFFEY